MDVSDDKVQINVQIPLNVREDFRAVAKFEGKSMSALLYRYILMTIRQAKAERPEIFPDFHDRPNIVSESEFDKMMIEAFDGKPPPIEEMKAIMKAVKEIMRVREIPSEFTPAPVVARIEPGKPTKDDVRRMINNDDINEIERRMKKKKAG